MTDPIADMLTRIRNAIAAKHSRVDIPASKLKLEIARILKEEGYINNFVIKGEGLKRTIRIFLRYDARGTSSITHLQRVSTPGRRVYVGSNRHSQSAWWLRHQHRLNVKRFDERKTARRENVGGELLAQSIKITNRNKLCRVWKKAITLPKGALTSQCENGTRIKDRREL